MLIKAVANGLVASSLNVIPVFVETQLRKPLYPFPSLASKPPRLFCAESHLHACFARFLHASPGTCEMKHLEDIDQANFYFVLSLQFISIPTLVALHPQK